MSQLRRFWIYERALLELPGSYKLWYNYLYECEDYLIGLPPTHPYFQIMENIYERSLTHMHKMPCIWEMYLKFLSNSRFKITKTRRAFDLALQALPITQHIRIWRLYVSFVKQENIPPKTVQSIYRRYLKLEPNEVEDYIDFLVQISYISEAVHWLVVLIRDENFVSKYGRSKQEFWIRLCHLAGQNAERLDVQVDEIILAACLKFKQETGLLWTALAGYYIRLGHFAKARDTFVHAIESVVNTNDFQVIWNAYVEFEYGLVTKAKSLNFSQENLSLQVARFEDLVDRQKLIMSDFALRNNQNDVNEWHRRLTLFEDSPIRQIEQFEASIRAIDPQNALGRLNTIWSRFARFWVALGRIEDARKVFEKGVQVSFKRVEQLTQLWCDYVEMELLEAEQSETSEVLAAHTSKALELVMRATNVPANYKFLSSQMDKETSSDSRTSQVDVHDRLWRQNKLWSLYVDLEHSYGTFQTTCAVYDRMLELRVVTPLNIFNYASYLESHQYYEKSFCVYEKGLDVFPFPLKMDILVMYLVKFIDRYKGTKLERTRDLFEQALEIVPLEYQRLVHFMYADFNENYGAIRHAMQVYERATRSVPDEDKAEVFDVYIAKASKWFGITRTRQVFEKAIESVSENHIRSYSLRYARLEIKLGEYNRARAIYTHCSQFCDPRSDSEFWQIWKEFEEAHGNTDTFKEMLRIRRSVIAQYSSIISESVRSKLVEQAKIIQAHRKSAQDDTQQPLVSQSNENEPPTQMEVIAAASPHDAAVQKQLSLVNNPDEIDINFEEETGIEVKQVPSTLFGSLEPMGAKAKLKRRSELASAANTLSTDQ